MTYELLKFAHLIGLALIAGGLIGVFVSDMRSRQLHDLPLFAESVRNIAVFYDGLVVPGALLLLASGTWLIVHVYGGWQFLEVPWLTGMIVLFAFEFIEGNTVTRLYFLRLRRLTGAAMEAGAITSELRRARAQTVPTFTHFLDLPLLLVIVSLGAIRPESWLPFVVGVVIALAVAAALTMILPRLYPWRPELGRDT
jgi:uncharacterized membrane protein